MFRGTPCMYACLSRGFISSVLIPASFDLWSHLDLSNNMFCLFILILFCRHLGVHNSASLKILLNYDKHAIEETLIEKPFASGPGRPG